MLPRGVTDDQVDRLLDKLVRIPMHARDFGVDADAAWRLHRLSPDLLATLRQRGLPTGGDGSYDRYDLLNVSMHLGTSATAVAARRFWAAGMARADQGEATRYEITYSLRCPQPGHDPVCRYRVHLPDGTVRHAESPPISTSFAAASIEVTLAAQWPDLPDSVRELLEVVRGLEFMRLPPAVGSDLAFLRSAGIGDCLGIARLLIAEGRRRGLQVRFASGLMIALPFSTLHHWAEVRVGERWVPVDPVFISALLEWGVLDPRSWHPYRSPGPVFCPLANSFTPLAEHEGRPVELAFPTRRLALHAQ